MELKAQYHIYIIFFLTLCLVFWFGRLSVQYQLKIQTPPVQTVSEINPKIPLIEIKDIQNAKVIGSVSQPEIRIKSGEQIAVPDQENNFTLDVQHLGYLGQKVPVIEVSIPEWANYVASKAGKYYYELDDKSAKNLSIPNRVYFATVEEAGEAGYERRNR